MRIDSISCPRISTYTKLVGHFQAQMMSIQQTIAENIRLERPIERELEMLKDVAEDLANAQQQLQRALGSRQPIKIQNFDDIDDISSTDNEIETDDDLISFDIR